MIESFRSAIHQMKIIDICGSQTVDPNDFGDPLTVHVIQQHFLLYWTGKAGDKIG